MYVEYVGSGDFHIHQLDALTYLNSDQEHAAEQPLKLFAGWFCPFVQRVWLALEEKGIPYQYIEGCWRIIPNLST